MTKSATRSVVVFADDHENWHTSVEETKDRYTKDLKNNLSGCEIWSAYDEKELFKKIEEAIEDETIEKVIVFLDLNFPSVQSGLKCLNRLKRNRNPHIRQIPVFVYSVSDDEEEVASVFSRNGNGFFHKLEHPETFWGALRVIDSTPGNLVPSPRLHEGQVNPPPRNDLPRGSLIK